MKFFRNLDLLPKISDEVMVKSKFGGCLSLFGWLLITVLALNEIIVYFTPYDTEHLIVDQVIDRQIPIFVNITFHALRCPDVHFDAMDIAGDNQLNVEHDMVKQRISADGVPIGKAVVERLSEIESVIMDVAPDYCGSCYGANEALGKGIKCCNTCAELLEAYTIKGWDTKSISQTSEQCKRDKEHNPLAMAMKGEGCRVSGQMTVNKVAGNFHMSLGDSVIIDGRHVHKFNPIEAEDFNVSHTIHELSFDLDQDVIHPLDNVTGIISQDSQPGLYQYFIKIVLSSAHLHQYTYTKRFRTIHEKPTIANSTQTANPLVVIPGVFFMYDFSPFSIVTERFETGMPLSHVILRVCALIGGTFSILRLVDGFREKMTKKQD